MKTNPTPYETLRQRITTLLPDILELKFGCKVSKYDRVFTWVSLKSYQDGSNICIYADQEKEHVYDVMLTNEEVEQFQILGREITLADVLRAINGIDLGYRRIVIGTTGHFYYELWNPEKHLELIPIQWNLKENLSGQSPETILFLLDVIK